MRTNQLRYLIFLIIISVLFLSGCEQLAGPDPASEEYQPWNESRYITFENNSSVYDLEVRVTLQDSDETIKEVTLDLGEKKQVSLTTEPISIHYTTEVEAIIPEEPEHYVLFVDN